MMTDGGLGTVVLLSLQAGAGRPKFFSMASPDLTTCDNLLRHANQAIFVKVRDGTRCNVPCALAGSHAHVAVLPTPPSSACAPPTIVRGKQELFETIAREAVGWTRGAIVVGDSTIKVQVDDKTKMLVSMGLLNEVHKASLAGVLVIEIAASCFK